MEIRIAEISHVGNLENLALEIPYLALRYGSFSIGSVMGASLRNLITICI